MKILILNHNSEFLPELIEYFENVGIQIDLKQPTKVNSVRNYNGIIASGGFLPKENYKKVLNWYKHFLNATEKPFLGICLGLRIIGFCHGARARRITLEEGLSKIKFHKNFLLAPDVKELVVYQSHEFELIPPLPKSLENYASGNTTPVQAIKVRKKQQFAVQFHPEKKNTDGHIILNNFLKLCK